MKPSERARLAAILARLEADYGRLRSAEPADAYAWLLFRNAGYPPSLVNCQRGFRALRAAVGLTPRDLAGASRAALRQALREGGIVPELRARRVQAIAERVQIEFGGDLRSLLSRPLPEVRKALARFPTIGEPGVDRLLLFSGTAAVAAVPSNALDVPLRLGFGHAARSWSTGYRAARAALELALPAGFAARRRAYLLLQRHGERVCRRSRPLCERCPVSALCPYFRRRPQAAG